MKYTTYKISISLDTGWFDDLRNVVKFLKILNKTKNRAKAINECAAFEIAFSDVSKHQSGDIYVYGRDWR